MQIYETLETCNLNSQEREALDLIINALQEPYKAYVLFDLEKRILFDTARQNKATLMLKLQDSILQLANMKAKNARLDTKGEFITDYEALRYKRKYFIAQILDIADSSIKYFLKDLVAKAME